MATSKTTRDAIPFISSSEVIAICSIALNCVTCISDSTCSTAHRMAHNFSFFACPFGHKYVDSSDDYGNMIFLHKWNV